MEIRSSDGRSKKVVVLVVDELAWALLVVAGAGGIQVGFTLALGTTEAFLLLRNLSNISMMILG